MVSFTPVITYATTTIRAVQLWEDMKVIVMGLLPLPYCCC